MKKIKVEVEVPDNCVDCKYLTCRDEELGKFGFSMLNMPYCSVFRKSLMVWTPHPKDNAKIILNNNEFKIIKCEECAKGVKK